MTQRITFLLLAFLLVASLQAQTKVQLSIPDVIAPGGVTEICVPIIADSFPNIASLQFSIDWDTTQVTFTEARLGDNPLGLDDMAASMPESNIYLIAFLTPGLVGITLEPGTVILELCFDVTMESGSTPLNWDAALPGEFAQEGTIVAFPDTLLSGSINYGSNVATTMWPGDTNDDGQIDHKDLLNIGLIHGTSGPARTPPGVTFEEKVAPAWPNSFNSGLNQAKVDCDGNGLIESQDLTLVETYYGRIIDGLWEPGNGASTGQGPALALVGGPINSGERSTLSVAFGENNDPLAVGYGMAFVLNFNPDQIDLNTISVDFDDSYLGEDLLTIARLSPNENGRLEIALSRKDQVNTTNPGGEVCKISFIALDNVDGGDYDLTFQIVPDTFLLADQSSADIQGSNTTITVMGTVAVREPNWGRELIIFPNPYTAGPLNIRGNLPSLDRLVIFDVNGQRVRRLAGTTRDLDLSDLSAGTYLLQLEKGAEKVVRKIIKQ
ncbi:T9SS type A sorting domain-containing protein [Neolewinella persica]|uniref:T9SS type A sorting domain-containing protein n=1 Tax=Neolewinella persica TaxID=70998 RepID=UPI000380287C|nr:T9SS type A sorting domain-containing protein [Neolewinella persica]